MSIAAIAARAMRPQPTTLSPAKLTINHPSARIGFLPTAEHPADTPPHVLQGSPRLAEAIRRRLPLLLAPSVVEAIRSIYGTPEFPYIAVGTEFDRDSNDGKWSDVLTGNPKVFDRAE